MPLIEFIKNCAQRVKLDAMLLWFARRHPDTPFLVKGLCAFAVAYALSPIDLIPDFIPILGYLDDMLLLPAIIWLALRLLPAPVIHACRLQARQWLVRQAARPASHAGALAIVLVWLAALYFSWRWYSG